MEKEKKKEIFRMIKLSLIDRPDDIVRMEIDQGELQELAMSISERGLLQPIEVTPRGKRFLIVFGDRRFLAHKMLKKAEIMCRIEKIEDVQVVLDRAMENVQRVNLTPFEEGHIYQGLLEKAGMKIDEISQKVGKSPGVVNRRLDILRMPESFQRAIHSGKVSITVAEELWSCPDASKREYFMELAVEHGITREIARQWVNDYKKEVRSEAAANGDGGGGLTPYESAPIYRACDVCRDPVNYEDVKILNVCPECQGRIVEAMKGT